MPRRAKVSLAASAMSDLQAVLDWYTERGARPAGLRWVADLLDHIQALASHPDMGRVVPDFARPRLRELTRPPFRIVYRRDPDRVRVVRVWRGERLLTLPPGAEDPE